MSIHLKRQIEKLQEQIKELAQLTERALIQAVSVIEERDAELANRVIDADAVIDQMEVDIEEECLHTLALYQPVAGNLRYVVSVLKINNDLERIADMAGNIAKQGRFLADEPPLDTMPFDLRGMVEWVCEMLSGALRAMLESDADLAEKVRQTDDKVDAIHRDMFEQVELAMCERPDQIPSLIHLMNISRQLERIADLTTNIAEDVIYTVRGEIARHAHV